MMFDGVGGPHPEDTVCCGILIGKLSISGQEDASIRIRLHNQLVGALPIIPHGVIANDSNVRPELEQHVIDGKAKGIRC